MDLIIYIAIATIFVGGLAYFLVRRAPFIDEPFKSWALYLIIAVCAVILVLKVLLPLIKLVVGSI